MRTWEGVSCGETDVGDGFLDFRNISLAVQGEARRRPALGARIALVATLLTTIEHPVAGASLVGVDGQGNLKGTPLAGGSITTIASGLSPDIVGCFAGSNSHIYYTDDFDAVQRIDRGDAPAVPAGIAAPTVAPTLASMSGGVVTAGVHRFRYRYRDTITGYVSNPSAELQVTASGSTGVTVNVTASGDAKVNQIILEVTLSSGSTFYLPVTGPNTTGILTFNLPDTSLEVQQATDATYGDFGQELPPAVELMVEHRGRLFGWKTSKRVRTGCTVANASVTISGLKFPTTTAWAGRLALINSETTPYLIASTTGTSITLATAYAGSASGSANTITVYSPTPDMLYWSRGLFPEAWQPAAWARRVLNNVGDRPTAMASVGDDLWLFGTHCARRLEYTADPAFGRIDAVPGALGCWNQRCVINADGRVFGFGATGIWELQYGALTHISKAADRYVQQLMDVSQSESFHGVYDPLERTVTWFYTRVGDSAPRDAITYDLDIKEWLPRSWRQPIRASIVAGSTQVTPTPYLADSNGYTWRVTPDLPGDGLVPALMTNGVLSAASGASATVIPVNQALPTSPNLAGIMLFNPLTGQSAVIASNTSSSITLATALSGAPATNSELVLGSIDCYMLSEYWPGPTLQAVKRPSYLTVEHLSTFPVTGQLQVFKDFSATPLPFSREATYTPPNGVTFSPGATMAAIDTSVPVLYLNQFAEFGRVWGWSFLQYRSVGLMRMLDIAFVIDSKANVDGEIKT